MMTFRPLAAGKDLERVGFLSWIIEAGWRVLVYWLEVDRLRKQHPGLWLANQILAG